MIRVLLADDRALVRAGFRARPVVLAYEPGPVRPGRLG